MFLDELGYIVNRAFFWIWTKESLLWTWVSLLACALLTIFFRSLSYDANVWIALATQCVPYFVAVGIMTACGIVMIRIYHDHLKNSEKSVYEVLRNAWRVLGLGLNFSLPVLLGFLALWVALGLFVLVSLIPMLGEFFSVVFSFIPFLLAVGILGLFIVSFILLFVGAPLLALNADTPEVNYKAKLKERLIADPFMNVFLGLTALIPLVLSAYLLQQAYHVALDFLPPHSNPIYDILQSLMIAIPFTALLTPFVVFFFNLSAEAHVYVLKRAKANSSPSNP